MLRFDVVRSDVVLLCWAPCCFQYNGDVAWVKIVPFGVQAVILAVHSLVLLLLISSPYVKEVFAPF